jgi:hypothetical protein
MTETNLLSEISQEELDAIAKELVNEGDPAPISSTITEQEARMATYISGYTLNANHELQLLRALVLHELYRRLGKIPEKRKQAYDAALSELRDIRDGKFPSLLSVNSRATWGSEDKI